MKLETLVKGQTFFFAIKSGHTPHLGISIARYQGESKIRLIGKKELLADPSIWGWAKPYYSHF